MDNLTFRPATRLDFPAIRKLIAAVQINPTGLDWRRFLVVSSGDDMIIGCGQIKPHTDGSRELASIAVQQQFRGRGVARGIIKELLYREKNRPVYLMCRASLESFYNRFGFQSISSREMPPYFKRISRLARVFITIRRADNRLLVMRLD